MISLNQLKDSREQMQQIVNSMQTRHNTMSAAITAAKSDQTRSQAYIQETVKKIEEDAKPWFLQKLEEITSLAKIVRKQSEPWESKPLLLSRQRFSNNPAEDSTIRLRHATELALMDQHFFKLTAEMAKEEKDLPMIFACFLQSLAKADTLDLSDVVIPGQEEALDVIFACDALPAQAYLIAGQAGVVSMTATRKLELGRQMARPDQKNAKPAATERTHHIQPHAA